ncbi:MAG TPA: PadR family transcriptional regulator [Solirubrobacteraceae bacterium]|nr:PadR family transcriptional regulator [Solirubrobacteraceae bacterium]
MMRSGRWYWSASESQYYAEPKRLAALGYLTAHTEPGITRPRTVYRLTGAGRAALRDWLARPSGPPRIQDEPIVRLMAAEFVDREITLAALSPLRAQLREALDDIAANEQRAAALPHRERMLHINHRLARRMVEAHRLWLDEVEQELASQPPEG